MNQEIKTSQGAGGEKAFWQFKNSANAQGEATLYIYGDIVTYDMGDWNFPDDVVPNKFRNELKALGDVRTLHVRINSGGGSVFAAYAIMNLLKSHPAGVWVYNDGIAASAATVIAMAGDRIFTALGSVWMVHLPAMSLRGVYDAKALAKTQEALGVIQESMLEIYSERTGLPKGELETMMEAETWLTGTQAVELGLADEVVGAEAVACLSMDKRTAFFNGLAVGMDALANGERLMELLPLGQGTGNSEAAPGVAAQKKEENRMDVQALKEQYPEVYNAVWADGAQDGAGQERARMREIDALALPGMEGLVNRAKYETGATAAELAVDLIKAQKQQGERYLRQAQADAAPLETVAPAAPPDQGEEARAMLEYVKAQAEKIRR
jgi:ATP-dependent protease ClpP protease subunit